MNINQVKEIFDFLVNEHQGGSVSPDEFTLLFNSEQLNYYNSLIGLAEQNQYGRPVPRIGADLGDAVMRSLAPFTTYETGYTIPNGKMITAAKVLSMNRADGLEIRPVTHGALPQAVNSALLPINQNPRYLHTDRGYQLFPTQTTIVNMTWVRQPVAVKWNYTIRDSREVYNPTGSVDPEWFDADINKIIGRMLKKAGIPLKDGELMQMGENIKNTGE